MSLSRRPGPSVRVRVEEYVGDAPPLRHEDRLATEEPLEVRLAWPGRPAERVGVTMRTPGHDFELAVGLLYAEGALVLPLLDTVAYCTDVDLSPEQEFNVVTVTLGGAPPRVPSGRGQTVTAAASACGVCGTDSIDDVLSLSSLALSSLALSSLALSSVAPAAEHEPSRVSPQVLRSLPDSMRDRQRVFASTGGLHAAALFDRQGQLLLLREDVGRHNAVDKVVGARLLAGEPPAAPILCVSGRIGFEIVQKAVAAGVGVLAAIGAPSSLAVRLADEAGLGLVGFLAPSRFVVYAGGDRIGT